MQSQARKGGSKHGIREIYEQAGRLGHRGSRGGGGGEHAGPRQGAHRHLLVGFHAIEHHLDDLAAQLDALLGAVLGVGQVEEGGAACHLNILVVLVALEGCDDQLHGRQGMGPRLASPVDVVQGQAWGSSRGSHRSKAGEQKAGPGHGPGTRPVLGQVRHCGVGWGRTAGVLGMR